MMKFAREGYPFIIGSATVTVVVALFFFSSIWIALIPLTITSFMLLFFRDPDRNVPSGKNLFVSPADGKIIVIKDVHEERHLNREMKQISIFMSPLNVHVNRSPCSGRVRKISYLEGRFLAAYKDEASLQNEQIEVVLETRYGDILLRQVAGFVARRAVCRVKEGDILQRGERYGMIKFSSRVDVYFPKDAVIKVNMNDMVKAGESVLAEIKGIEEE